ncbi:MAG TPA: hypothetical protein VGT04_04535 [Acidobacteriaceae bacterium]|nr:hypothetical protein [Acidobacteriaceae bacterium]
MQNTKDTFYITLRNRLKAVNPERTMTLRGVVRPGILVEEAEGPTAMLPLDAFVLRWTKFTADTQLPSALAVMTCEIHYATAGTQGNAGLDRGRALEEMDYELLQMLCPTSAQKMNYTQSPAAQMGTSIFWSPATFATETTARERVGRVATVQVFAFQEQGEQ